MQPSQCFKILHEDIQEILARNTSKAYFGITGATPSPRKAEKPEVLKATPNIAITTLAFPTIREYIQTSCLPGLVSQTSPPVSSFSFSLDDAVKRLPNKSMDAEVAQPVEQRIRNAWVVSSNLILGSSFS